MDDPGSLVLCILVGYAFLVSLGWGVLLQRLRALRTDRDQTMDELDEVRKKLDSSNQRFREFSNAWVKQLEARRVDADRIALLERDARAGNVELLDRILILEKTNDLIAATNRKLFVAAGSPPGEALVHARFSRSGAQPKYHGIVREGAVDWNPDGWVDQALIRAESWLRRVPAPKPADPTPEVVAAIPGSKGRSDSGPVFTRPKAIPAAGLIEEVIELLVEWYGCGSEEAAAMVARTLTPGRTFTCDYVAAMICFADADGDKAVPVESN